MTFILSFLHAPATLYERLALILNYGQDALLLILRLYWGWQFFQTGKGKLLNFDRTVEFFTGLNIPFPELNAALAGATECIGGLLLIAGLASRLTSLQLIVVMIVAYPTADAEVVANIFTNPDDFTSASPFLFLLVAVIIALFGAGKFSLDEIIQRFWATRRAD
jgi:putative oxidoreductase